MRRAVLFGIVFALIIQNVSSQLHVRLGNLWVMYLEKSVESSAVLFRDGTLIVLTEYLDGRVAFPWEYIFKGRSPKDLMVVIHNHLGINRWSAADKSLYRALKEAGFNGYFLCRLGNGTVLQMEDSK